MVSVPPAPVAKAEERATPATSNTAADARAPAPDADFNPQGREQFMLAAQDLDQQAAGYAGFCRDREQPPCKTRLSYATYNGMKGYFEMAFPSATQQGFDLYPVVLQNGERLFYAVKEGRGRFGRGAPIVPVRQFGGEPSFFSEPLVPGSSIQLTGLVVNEGVTFYTTSNGKEVTEQDLALIREVSALLGKRGAAAAELLLELDIQKDEAGGRYFVNPRGSVLRSEYRLYLGVQQAGYGFRLRVKYYAVDWLFTEGFSLVADGFTWSSPKLPFTRDHAAGYGWEWLDLPVGKRELDLAARLGNANQAAIRFQGAKAQREQVLAEDQKAGLRQMLRLHALLRSPK